MSQTISHRQIPKREADALKAASHSLVEASGGVIKAAGHTQSSPSRLSEAVSPWHENRWLSLIHVADLECVAGAPLVTRVLAQMAGYDLVSQLENARPQDFHQHLAHIIIETGDVESHLAKALEDGTVTRAEALQGLRETQQAIARLQNLEADFRRIAKVDVKSPVSLAAVKP